MQISSITKRADAGVLSSDHKNLLTRYSLICIIEKRKLLGLFILTVFVQHGSICISILLTAFLAILLLTGRLFAISQKRVLVIGEVKTMLRRRFGTDSKC